MIDRQSKQLLDRSVLRRFLNALGGRDIRRSVLSYRDVNLRMIEDDRVEAELGAQERDDFYLREQAVNVNQRRVGRGFFPMHGDVAHFDLEVKRDNVEAADLGVATGNAL